MAFFGQLPPQQHPQEGISRNSNFGANFDEDDDDVIVESFGGNSIGIGGERERNVGNFMHTQALSREFAIMKQENQAIKDAISELQSDRDKLRIAVRKLKIENSRFKAKLKRISGVVAAKQKSQGENSMETEDKQTGDALDDDVDFDDIGEFLLIGGANDPLAVQYRSPIRDASGIEHKSIERYLLYKMAETFNDQDATSKILAADTPTLAEEIARNINFDQKTWDAAKLKHWEDGQRLKFEQYRSLKCLLVKTGKQYLAVASQDKVFGTGWRKQREEATKPHMWDGENRGGKFLMKLRDEYAASHTWTTSAEEQEAQNSFYENKRNVWRRLRRDESGSTRGRSGKRMARNVAPTNSSHRFAPVIDRRLVNQPVGPSPLYYTGIGDPGFVGFTPFQSFPRRVGSSSSRGGGPPDKRFRF